MSAEPTGFAGQPAQPKQQEAVAAVPVHRENLRGNWMSSVLIYDVRKSYGDFGMRHGVTVLAAISPRQYPGGRNTIFSSVNGPQEPR
jgi:hypothetical protein